MTDLALKANKEGANPSLAKGEVDGWTTVSRKTLRGRPANVIGTEIKAFSESKSKHFKLSFPVLDDAINERRLQNQSGKKAQHKNQGSVTSKHHSSGPSHVKILRRNSSIDGSIKEISFKEGDNKERHKTGGILRIPDMNMLTGVVSSDRWREFNATNEMWPSIDASKEDDNKEAAHSKVKSYSSIVTTAPPPVMTAPIEDRKVCNIVACVHRDNCGVSNQCKSVVYILTYEPYGFYH